MRRFGREMNVENFMAMAIIDDTKTELTVRGNKIVDKHRDIQTKRGKS